MIPFVECELSELDIDPTQDLAFDTETIGLYGKIRLAQFYQVEWETVKLVHNPNPLELATILNTTKFVAHNAHYDITVIQTALGGISWEPNEYDDTFYLARLKYFSKEKFSLDAVMTYVLGYDPYEKEGIDKSVMQKINWDIPVLATNQKVYASIDVYHLLDVYDAVKDFVDSTSYKLDKLALHYALDFQNNGMPVLQDALQQRYAENLAEIEKYDLPINVNSWKQVRPYIGSKNSDGLGLATLAIQGNERAGNVNTVRKLIKQNSFLNKFDTMASYIYGKFLPSARSGRFTSKDQNLEQIPRLLKVIFGYDTDDGKVLIYADYAQLEMRCITAITGELRMAGLLKAGEDLHDYTARMLFGDDFTPVQRQIAKTANFGLLYGCGAVVFQAILIKLANMILSEAECSAVKKKWRNLFSSIAKWQDEGIKAQRKGLAWQTPFGRKYVGKMMTDQLNIQNQGFGAEVAKLAMHYMEPEIKRYNEDNDTEVRMLNFIHDSFIYECPAEETVYKDIAEIVARSMQKAWFEACRTGINLVIRDLPMPVEVFVGYNWGRIEKDYLYKYELEGMEHYEAS